MLNLRPYQEEAVTAAIESLRNNNHALLVLPTGAGKTVIFCEVARRLTPKGGTCLVLAHRRELVEQAAAKLSKTPGNWLYKSMTVQSAKPEDIEAAQLVIVDECHHAKAETYMALLSHATCPVMGVTATPERLDGKDVRQIFGDVVYSIGRDELTEAGYLADCDVFTVPLKMEARNDQGVLTDQSAEHAISTNYKRLIAAIRPVIEGRHAVVFTPTVALAKKVAASLGGAWVSGAMPAKTRKQTLADFAEGSIPVITCAALLTEGWDAPIADTAVMLKPTESDTLYTQMIGRVLRTCDDKDRALIVDFLFSTVGALDLAGWTPDERMATLGQRVNVKKDRAQAAEKAQEIRRELALYDAIAKHEAEKYGMRRINAETIKKLNLDELPTEPAQIDETTRNAFLRLKISLEGIYNRKMSSRVLNYALTPSGVKAITA